MIYAATLEVLNGGEHLALSAPRYALLRRMAQAAAQRNVAVLAFGCSEESYRFVLEGKEDQIRRLLRACKSGTARAALSDDVRIVWNEDVVERVRLPDLTDAVRWAHEVAAGDPLANPWTSCRDLLGLRTADFYDAHALAGRADLSNLRLRRARLPNPSHAAPPLALLLRIAASIHGVMPAARQTFRLFVHLGRACGFHAEDLAKALVLTVRRVRQLFEENEPLFDVALLHLADDRLACIP